MPYVLKVLDIPRTGDTFDYDVWLSEADVNAMDGLGTAGLTTEKNKAMTFSSFQEAWNYWRQPSTVMPVRPDGKANRPLTAFTVEIEPLSAKDPDPLP